MKNWGYVLEPFLGRSQCQCWLNPHIYFTPFWALLSLCLHSKQWDLTNLFLQHWKNLTQLNYINSLHLISHFDGFQIMLEICFSTVPGPGGVNPGSFLVFIYFLFTSSALDHSATAPPYDGRNVWNIFILLRPVMAAFIGTFINLFTSHFCIIILIPNEHRKNL